MDKVIEGYDKYDDEDRYIDCSERGHHMVAFDEAAE